MTRFKELKRIETAILHKNEAKLQWALNYCKMRIQIAAKKNHEAHWRRIEKRVKAALLELRSAEYSG